MKISSAITLSTLALTSVLVTSGCSFSHSSESSSTSSKGLFNSVASPFSASSDSSATEQEKYENDVADYTAEFVVSSTGSMESFRGRLSELAEKHDVTNWESDHTTYVGIGRGMAKAKIGNPQISAFTESLSNKDPMKKQAIEEGLKK